jgi:hypothetical protein
MPPFINDWRNHMKKSSWVVMAMAVVSLIGAAGILLSAEQKAALSTAGGVITLKGTENQNSPTVAMSQGAYIVRRTAGEDFMSITVKGGEDAIYHSTFFSEPDGSYLLIVGSKILPPGNVFFEGMGMGAWTVTITKVDPSTAVALPLVISGAELKTAISKPFKAAAGELVMTYAYKSEPEGTGTLTVCDVVTGKTIPMSQMMYAGNISGGWNIPIPAAGVYIAEATFPKTSGGGEVKLSQ